MNIIENSTETSKNILTVSELNLQIKRLLESEIYEVWLRGEVSDYKCYSSGHAYFNLKDENAVINAVLFKGHRMKIKCEIENGLSVLAHGRVSVYEKQGRYQIIVDMLEPEGIGALQLAFEQLKKKLMEEGLFSEEHKKPIPRFPSKIGVVTSPTGAAIRDVLNTTERRFPLSDIYVFPTSVQGDNAPKEIIEAIETANIINNVDVLIVGRGGGSYEDLVAFNDEGVARAIFNSHIPIVSAVGHQIDYTIADFVADIRAATPTAAAELVVPDKSEIIQQLDAYKRRVQSILSSTMNYYREKVAQVSPKVLNRLITQYLEKKKLQLDDYVKRLNQNLENQLSASKNKLILLNEKLKTLNPLSILERGYSVTYKSDGDVKSIVKSYKEVNKSEKIEIKLAEGTIIAVVEETSN